ncbi:MAG: hypothetical protein ACJ72N_24970 [Labedaea sp.]
MAASRTTLTQLVGVGAGDRRLNYALHVIAITQIRYNSPGRVYYQRNVQRAKATKKHCAASNADSTTSSTEP